MNPIVELLDAAHGRLAKSVDLVMVRDGIRPPHHRLRVEVVDGLAVPHQLYIDFQMEAEDAAEFALIDLKINKNRVFSKRHKQKRISIYLSN